MDESITALYVRVSTTKDSQKDSPEHQKGLCEEKARILGLQILYTYEDRDTGTSIVARTEIQRLITEAKQGKFRTIIFASLSRFSRDTLDSLNLKRILVDALHIRVISIEEGYDSRIDNDELKFQIISAVNQKLSEQISLSSKRGIRQSAMKGNFTGSFAAYGYKKTIIGERKTIVPDEKTKGIVDLIYDLYINHNMGDKSIVNYLNEKKIAAYKGGVWGLSSIQRILTNQVYTGRNIFCKYETTKVYNDINNLSDRSKKQVQRNKSQWESSNEKTHEPIIADELFQKVQAMRLFRGGGKRGGIRASKNVFAGIIFCTHCGCAMVSMKSTSGRTKSAATEYRYLVCSKRRRQGATGCDNSFWLPYKPFRDELINNISEILGRQTSLLNLFEQNKGLILIDADQSMKYITDTEKKIDKYRELLFETRKLLMLGEMDEAQYSFEKQRYEKEIKGLEQHLGELNVKKQKKNDIEDLYEEVRDALDDLISLNYEEEDEFMELKSILVKLIARISVDWEGNIEVKTTFGINLSEIPSLKI
ncbi:recombinase family protein [Paenibacillus psychroresistens]|uniref:Recombinase family protein n=1 Tax=Paenibacillus psychroresistens TaxID=1778678 RepID=A0A6B8RQ52_9BACL|nr:recombinase family protein [Paenibacillus psychroresistens]QGQ97934.1 recombinase family protein [Paenibacillus psychroresistens]